MPPSSSRWPRCRIIVRYGIGVDNVDLDAAAKRGIPVCNVPDYCVDEVADHTLAFILALARKVVPGWDVVRAGEWKLAVPLEEMHVLKELTVGLVAYGKIAKEVAARLKAFKSKVLVFDPYVPANEIENDGLVPTDLEGLLGNSDLISLHCPSTAETRQMINSQSIGTMKRGVMLVNTSRGRWSARPILSRHSKRSHLVPRRWMSLIRSRSLPTVRY